MPVQRAAPKIIITLDGPAGVGKSSLGKELANALPPELGLAFLDTGAMFRATAYFLGEAAGEADGPDSLAARLEKLDFTLRGSGEASELLCNGRVPGREIRSESIGAAASRLALNREVRDFLRKAQQKIGAQYSLVAEGRDMGTVVFPSADCKFFLDARPEVRALRRRNQLLNQNAGKDAPVPDLECIERLIRQRDEQDRQRALAPLRPAEDAVIIDTSDLERAEVLAKLLAEVRKKLL
jgi:cytidylate kinase